MFNTKTLHSLSLISVREMCFRFSQTTNSCNLFKFITGINYPPTDLQLSLPNLKAEKFNKSDCRKNVIVSDILYSMQICSEIQKSKRPSLFFHDELELAKFLNKSTKFFSSQMDVLTLIS